MVAETMKLGQSGKLSHREPVVSLCRQLWEVTALTVLPTGLPTTPLMALLAASLILA